MLAQTEQKTQPSQQTQGMLEVTGALAPEHQAIFPVEAQTFYLCCVKICWAC